VWFPRHGPAHKDRQVFASFSIKWFLPLSQWAASLSGATRRLPPFGPRVPISTPILILVTQLQTMDIWYLRMRTAKSEFQVLQASLTLPNMTAENQPKPISKTKDPSWVGIKRCVSAAIGIGYNGERHVSIETYVILTHILQKIPPF
jgi:hypothetical protein